jgi:hypothetical protein
MPERDSNTTMLSRLISKSHRTSPLPGPLGEGETFIPATGTTSAYITNQIGGVDKRQAMRRASVYRVHRLRTL